MERCCDDQPRATHEAPTAHTVLSTHAMRRTQRRAPPRASAVSMNEHSESTPTRNKPRRKHTSTTSRSNVPLDALLR